jgi:4-hydroxybenzoate polyprenyltransferase
MVKTPANGRTMILVWLRVFLVPAYSLIIRVRNGEGGLLALTGAFIYLFLPPSEVHLRIVLTAILLGLIYGLNDIHDAPLDIRDKSRINSWSTTLASHQSSGYAMHVLQVSIFTIYCIQSGVCNLYYLISTFALSFLYSFRTKAVPILDFFSVFFLSCFFILSFGDQIPKYIVLNAGIMIILNHVFQMHRDLTCDANNKINTSAVSAHQIPRFFFFLSASAVVIIFVLAGDRMAGLISVLVMFVGHDSGFSTKGWLFLKVIQGFSWLAVILLSF